MCSEGVVLYMLLKTHLLAAMALFTGITPIIPAPMDTAPRYRVLVFTKTAGYRHSDAIEAGGKAIAALGKQHNFAVEVSEDTALFNSKQLSRFKVVVFLNTTGNILNDSQQKAFESFIANGNGYVGIHSAADTEYEWPWYGKLVGAHFAGHPHIQQATIKVSTGKFPGATKLPKEWVRTDEWYNYRSNPRNEVNVLMRLDEESYKGGTMGDDHPIAWAHEFGGGRAFYTGMGHTAETYAEPLFLEHLFGAIEWAAGKSRY